MNRGATTRVLGIESSCDETACAIITFDEDHRASSVTEVLSSQVVLHEAYGGVVPELAAREHLKNLPLLLNDVLKSAGCSLEDIDAIAVTRGPGLKGCLLAGYGFAKGVAVGQGIPLIGINHIEGHLLAPLLDNPTLQFPYCALVVSGGHTEIVEVRGVGDYTVVARTIDDAAGEAFDKSANLLGFSYPGGAKLAALADACPSSRFTLPKVMREASGFSFSGLKTAVSLLISRTTKEFGGNPEIRAELAHAIQGAIVDALLHKLKETLKANGFRSVAVTGGVSANKLLRKRVGEISGVTPYFPSIQHSTDNGAMIAFAGGLRYLRGDRTSLRSGVRAQWSVEEICVG